jgi:hypothetical protein
MMHAARRVVAAFLAAGSLGCASGGSSTNVGGDAAAAVGASRSTRRNPEIIDVAEISSRASEAANALQIVQKLRPQMLQGRGVSSPTDVNGETSRPKVYVDNVSYGDLGSLSNVIATQVLEIRYLNSRDATTRWGTGHMGGVILVTTKR